MKVKFYFRRKLMDYEIGTCPECGGILTYIGCVNVIFCDTCDYVVEEAN